MLYSMVKTHVIQIYVTGTQFKNSHIKINVALLAVRDNTECEHGNTISGSQELLLCANLQIFNTQ